MQVKRTDDKVWIDGVKGFNPGEYASSVHGAQAKILETLGLPVTYDDLICTSGFAFRVECHKAMCPSAGHPCCGVMCVDGSNRAITWKMKLYESFPWGKPKPDREAFEAEVCAAIKASIDRGIPVHYGSEEDGLIIGHADEGRRWWCVHPYHKGGRPFWHDEAKGFAGGKWPWAIVVWTRPKRDDERTGDRELLVGALRQAVEMWRTEKAGDYFVGEAAYAKWLGWLRDVEAGKVEDVKGGMQGNAWCFDVLVHSRRIAAKWLKQKAEGLDAEAAAHLRKAADEYAQLVEVCMKDLKCPWDLAVAPERFDDWTSAMRTDEIARLESARDHDRAAIAAIEQALAFVEKTR